MIKPQNILCILCLLIAGIGYLSASSPKDVKADKYGVKESASVDLLTKKKLDDGKITFKCRISRYNDKYMMLANVLKNDSAIYIARPGIKFLLANGDSVILKAERPSSCCSSWADGRWYNASFKLNDSDVNKFKRADVLTIIIPFLGGEISRTTASGKENAITRLLQSVEEN